ncbi:hypothetical protein PFISCL1PPCAC_19798, partial [Pristionchus fissidentatus]
ECMLADERGLLSKVTITVESSTCCKHIIFPSRVFCLSDSLILAPALLKFYESLLAMNGTTLSGYWRSLVDYAKESTRSTDDLISLSSLSREWNLYILKMEIPPEKFGCQECGRYPPVLVFDGIQMGIRSSIANESSVPNGKYTFPVTPLPYLGKLPERRSMLSFLDGGGDRPNINWPIPIMDLLNEAIDTEGKVKTQYKPLLKMLFANSPLPLIHQAGTRGRRREIIDRLTSGKLNWKDEELEFQRQFPVIYGGIRPLIVNDQYPETIRKSLKFMMEQSDLLLREYPHIEDRYGPPEESKLECFPLWPLERGLTSYTKDQQGDQLECAEKVIGENRKLSPGLMLVMCPHRRPYGFRVLKTPESVKDVFQIMLTRLGANMPQTIVYDNSCRLAVYCLAREASRFGSVRFLVDRFHSHNHKSCSHSLRLRSYESDPLMACINSQSCEQTNSLLRHLGNSLPFMSLARYIKTIQLSLSRN